MNNELLTSVAREEWRWNGYIVSDQNALSRVQESHHYTENATETAILAVKAGCNLELASGNTIYKHLLMALKMVDHAFIFK